jgi:hypothetical protein
MSHMMGDTAQAGALFNQQQVFFSGKWASNRSHFVEVWMASKGSNEAPSLISMSVVLRNREPLSAAAEKIAYQKIRKFFTELKEFLIQLVFEQVGTSFA